VDIHWRSCEGGQGHPSASRLTPFIAVNILMIVGAGLVLIAIVSHLSY